MNEKILEKTTKNMSQVLARPLLAQGFPFRKIAIERKVVTKAYLRFHRLQYKLLGKSDCEQYSDYEGVIIGHTGKVYQKENGEIGDYTNLFLKNCLNQKRINLMELLVPSLRELFISKHFLKKKDLNEHRSFFLPYVDIDKTIETDKGALKNRLLDRIKVFKEKDKDNQYTKSLDEMEKDLDLYLNFITSPAFLGYFFGMLLGMQKMLQRVKPQFVIVNSVVGLKDRLALFIAKENDLKTLLIPHGLGGTALEKDPLSPDIFVSQNYKRNKFKNSGKDTKVWNLGLLNFGYLLRNTEEKQNFSKEKTLMYATQPLAKDERLSRKDYEDFLTTLFLKFKDIADKHEFQLILKLHPRDDINFYKKILNKTDFNGVKFIKEPSPISIEKINQLDPDLVLTAKSTFGVEMIISGRPLLGVAPLNLKDNSPLLARKINFPVPTYITNELDELTRKIIRVLQDKEAAKKLLEKERGKLKGNGPWVEEESFEKFIKFLTDITPLRSK